MPFVSYCDTSKPPAGIGVKRNDLRPWRALAPTRLSGEIPPAGTAGCPEPHLLLPHPAPPPPLLSSPGRAVVSSSGHLCGPRRLPNVSQTSPKPLPDGSRTSPRRLPNPSQPSPSRLPDLSQPSPRRLPEEGGGHRKAPNGLKSGKGGILAFWVKKSQKSLKMSSFSILGPQNGQNGPIFAFWPPKCEKRCPKPFVS